jgi:hypothetical protein
MTVQVNPIQPRPDSIIPLGRACNKCSHIKVCGVFKAIAPLMTSFDQDKPFEPEQLARICKYFVSNELIGILNGDGGN